MIEKYGRKVIFVRFNVLAIGSCLVMQIVSLHTIALGKFFNGFFVTVCYIAAIKMLNESIPVYLLGTYGTLASTCTAIGEMLCLGLGLGLPSEDYNPALINDPDNMLAFEADKNDEFWRFCYLFPMFINLFMLSSFALFIKEDSIMYNLSLDRDDEALALIDKIYQKSESRKDILQNLKL